MTGIITGMLSLGDSSQSTALLGGFDIDVNNFMNELQNQRFVIHIMPKNIIENANK